MLYPLIFCAFVLIATSMAQEGPRCGHDNNDAKCPAEAPCCSSAGYCGSTPAHCQANCRVAFSAALDSCEALPVCASKTYTFGENGNARIALQDDYTKPDPDNVDFVVLNGNIAQTVDSIVLTLNDDSKNMGTALASTRAMHYGHMSIELQTAWSGGVVTAAILIGQISEEIDVEFVGSKLTEVQTNLFYDYKSSATIWDAKKDTSTSMHKYEVDWTKDAIKWEVDGTHIRTVTPSEFHIPELPMFMQMSIWPGGMSPNAGTREWAGAPNGINWEDSRYLAQNRSFEVFVKSVTLECGDSYDLGQSYEYKLAEDGKTITSDVA